MLTFATLDRAGSKQPYSRTVIIRPCVSNPQPLCNREMVDVLSYPCGFCPEWIKNHRRSPIAKGRVGDIMQQ